MAGLRLRRRGAADLGGPLFSGCVSTMGNFDGMHLGHRQLTRMARERADALGLPLVVVLFEPQPLEFLRPDKAPPRLTRLSEKLARLAEWGVDDALCLRFNADLAAMPAEDFIQRVLVDTLRTRCVIVGDDFRFGRDRRGGFETLAMAGERLGFAVHRQPSVSLDSERLSSTWVRRALVANDLALAWRLLGRPFSKGGCVVKGAKRGRRLGFPTANMVWRGEAPLSGIYVSRLSRGGRVWNGVSYVGRRPFYGDTEQTWMETYLLDYNDGELYGQWVWLDFLEYLRGDLHFNNTDELVAQIGRDVEMARRRHDAGDGELAHAG